MSGSLIPPFIVSHPLDAECAPRCAQVNSRWCRDCGHEGHNRGRCLSKMPMSRVVQDIARGKAVPNNLRCQCDYAQRGGFCGYCGGDHYAYVAADCPNSIGNFVPHDYAMDPRD